MHFSRGRPAGVVSSGAGDGDTAAALEKSLPDEGQARVGVGILALYGTQPSDNTSVSVPSQRNKTWHSAEFASRK